VCKSLAYIAAAKRENEEEEYSIDFETQSEFAL